ncbi:MAG TPA: ABC transporter permease [Candidatus Acidoferrales bacterium]|nr:ABC transporter permease [Candidatus Acidoferrales bacterium]
MGTFWQDVRYGIRMLAKNRGFAIIAVLTLALGIGANTAIFSVVNAVLLEPLPYKDSGKLVFIWSTMISQGIDISGSSAPDFREWRSRNRVFTDMAASYYANVDLSARGDEPARLRAVAMTPGFFPLLGVNPAVGRGFLPEEGQWGKNRVVLLSYALWQSKFGADKNILKRTVHLDGQDYSIVGVMPRGMPFFDNLPLVDLFMPLSYAPKDDMNTRDNHYLYVVARLKPGVTLPQAQAEMSGVASEVEKEFPVNKGVGAKVKPVREQLVGDVRQALLILLGAVGFVLLIACANLANLMLARATTREQEFAVRAALGASRSRLVRQLLTENLLIAAAGGLGGILLAIWGMEFLESLIPTSLPRFHPIGVNAPVLIFTAALSLLTALFFSLAPILHSSKRDVQSTLREAGRSGMDGKGRRLRSVLVVAELALAMLLLVGSGLLIATFGALRHTDPGFSSAHVLTMSIPLSPAYFPDGHVDEAIQFCQDLIVQVNALPGVKNSGVTTTLPLGFGNGWGKLIDVQGHAPATSLDKVPVVRFQLSSPGYMPAIGARLRQGRFFTDQDNQQAPGVAIINEALARQLFPNENPIGKSIRMTPPLALLSAEYRVSEDLAPLRTIVGVIADMKDTAMNQPALSTVFAPYFQFHHEGWNSDLVLTVKTAGDPLALAKTVRELIQKRLPDQPVSEVSSMDLLVGRSLSGARFSMLLISIFAGLALALAAVGIYGVMAYLVAQRTREIGIRLALGAEPKDVLRVVMEQGAKLALAGVAIGIVAALGLTRLMSSLLYGVKPTDFLTYLSVTAVLVLVALAACFLPALRASHVDPMVALRHE